MHSFHLVRVRPQVTLRALVRPPTPRTVPGLRRVECMFGMTLGSPVVSTGRIGLTRLAVFAAWDDEESLERFLAHDPWGRRLAKGWHVRLEFLRRWGEVAEFADLPRSAGPSAPDEPVVAVTLARTRLREMPRFLRWGKPVEVQVRDHPGTTVALAAMRPPRTLSTFTVWRTTREMVGMTHGRPGAGERLDPDQVHLHAAAIAERDRRDFHHEFTTLRFRPLSEHGHWDGRGDLVPRN